MSLARRSADRLQSLRACLQAEVERKFPPVVARKNLDLKHIVIAEFSALRREPLQGDHAVSHHAPIERRIGRPNHPVGNMISDNAIVIADRGKRFVQLRVPPAVVHVDRDIEESIVMRIGARARWGAPDQLC